MVETLKRRKRRFYKSLAIGLFMSLLTSLASYMGYLEGWEAKALDCLLWLRGDVKTPEIVIVEVNDQAFANLGEKQPLPRSYVAGLIELVGRSGAKVIGVDVELKVQTNRLEDEAILEAIQATADDGVSRVVPVYIIRQEKAWDGSVSYARSAFFSPELTVVAGFANAPVDSDGRVRQLPLVVRGADGKVLPSFALAVLARYAGYDAKRLEEALDQRGRFSLLLPEWDRFRGTLLPQRTPLSFELDDVWKINFVGAQGNFKSLPSDPVFRLSTQKIPLAADNPFRNKIVLIGVTFTDSRDFYSTPRGLMSGVEIQANAIHTILSRAQILPMHRLLGLLIAVFFALVISLLLTLLRPSVVNMLSIVALPLLLVPSYWAFARLGLWVDFVTPVLVIRWGAYVGGLLEGRHIRKSLGAYVDREVANQIVDEEESLRGEQREVSVFFTDVRNYTTLCEAMEPAKVVGILNELFGMMGKVIKRHHGCIVDFIGDAVLAVFGAPKKNPQHAWDAVQTALEVQEELNELNERWQKMGIPPLTIGVGIHTGEALVGIVGSGERKKFGVTGDTVNTGSRVEGLNKEFATSILITRETLEQVNGKIPIRSCGAVSVKGRAKPVEVFEVVSGDATNP